MLNAVWNKSWKQHSIKEQLYRYLPTIKKTISSKQDMQDTTGEASDILLLIFTHGFTGVGQQPRTLFTSALCGH